MQSWQDESGAGQFFSRTGVLFFFCKGVQPHGSSWKKMPYIMTCLPADGTWGTCWRSGVTLVVSGSLLIPIRKQSNKKNVWFEKKNRLHDLTRQRPRKPVSLCFNTKTTIKACSPLLAAIKFKYTMGNTFWEKKSSNKTFCFLKNLYLIEENKW